jgi:succinoglycan biosynthesis transport protein ExoP
MGAARLGWVQCAGRDHVRSSKGPGRPMNNQLYPIGARPLELQPVGQPAVQPNDLGTLNARDILNIFVRHKLMIAAIVLIVTSAVALRELVITPQYMAKSVTKIEVLPSSAGVQVSPVEREMRLDTQTKLMASAAMAQAVAKDLNLHRNRAFMERGVPEVRSPAEENDAIKAAAEKLHLQSEVKRPPRTQLIEVSVVTPSPRLSARIADHYVVALQNWEDRARIRRRQLALADLGPQVKSAEEKVQSAEMALAAARAKYRMLPGAGSTMDLAQINHIANEFVAASGQSAGLSTRASGVARSGIGGISPSAESSPALFSQQRQYDELMRRKSELSVTYGNNYPELKAVNSQLGELEASIAAESERARAAAFAAAAANAARDTQMARSEASGAAARAGAIGNYLRTYTAKAFSNTRDGVFLAQLERDLYSKRDAYVALSKRMQLAMSDLGAGAVNATALSGAAIPIRPINVARSNAIMAAFIGSLVLGCLLALVREMMDGRLWSSNQSRRRFGIPTFAMLPRVDEKLLSHPSNNPIIRHPRSIFAESAGALYRDVIRLRGRTSPQVVAVSSALPGEGKSTVALSLATAAVAMGRRAILIDLDLRRHGVLQVMQRESNAPDLTDYLSHREPLDRLVPAISMGTGQDIASPVLRGPAFPAVLSVHNPVPDPAALIASAELGALVEELKQQFDFIVLNAPPLLAVRDAKVLSDLADDTLMVVRWGKTTIDEFGAAVDTLDLPPTAVIFNDVDYAEHARRRYRDPIQYAARAVDYYEDAGIILKPAIARRIRNWVAKRWPALSWS